LENPKRIEPSNAVTTPAAEQHDARLPHQWYRYTSLQLRVPCLIAVVRLQNRRQIPKTDTCLVIYVNKACYSSLSGSFSNAFKTDSAKDFSKFLYISSRANACFCSADALGKSDTTFRILETTAFCNDSVRIFRY